MGAQKRKNWATVNKVIGLYKKWSKDSPHNCLDKLHLLEAEKACLLGKGCDAYAKYTCAIALAGEEGFTMIQALGNECMARHLFRREDQNLAVTYFEKAISLY